MKKNVLFAIMLAVGLCNSMNCMENSQPRIFASLKAWWKKPADFEQGYSPTTTTMAGALLNPERYASIYNVDPGQLYYIPESPSVKTMRSIDPQLPEWKRDFLERKNQERERWNEAQRKSAQENMSYAIQTMRPVEQQQSAPTWWQRFKAFLIGEKDISGRRKLIYPVYETWNPETEAMVRNANEESRRWNEQQRILEAQRRKALAEQVSQKGFQRNQMFE